MPRLIVTGFAPLDSLVLKELKEREKNFDGLTIEKLEGQEILRNPDSISNDDVLICGQTIYKVFIKLNVSARMVPVRVQINDFIHALTIAKEIGNEVNVINYNKDFFCTVINMS
ncbi:hypothetical protein [Geomicrobium sp. JCM 19055]|uniref:hypothetical protein n=1 Tax=Geomicrobium sp. JCM 19055 TaxID=1460649 RepID=UPI00045EDDBB|nr:hypothetical protein [Geomicrobium sp. JCM 19055]GAK00570.1 hypothetical protein JCM19055_3666 [Geomicrobium sp. JCM 19055]